MCWAPGECWLCASTLQNPGCHTGMVCECTCACAFCFKSEAFFQRHLLMVWKIQALASRAVIQFHVFFQQGDLIWLKAGLACVASCTSVRTSVIPCHVCEVIFLKHNRDWKTVRDFSERWWHEDFQPPCVWGVDRLHYCESTLTFPQRLHGRWGLHWHLALPIQKDTSMVCFWVERNVMICYG